MMVLTHQFANRPKNGWVKLNQDLTGVVSLGTMVKGGVGKVTNTFPTLEAGNLPMEDSCP